MRKTMWTAVTAATTMTVSVAVLIIACRPTNAPQPFPPSPLPSQGYLPPSVASAVIAATVATPDAGVPVASPVPTSPVTAPVATKAQALGSACDVNTDCASGFCGGQGCGQGAGVCRAPISTKGKRAVAKPAPSTICGCDGKTETVDAMYLVRYAYAGGCKTPTGAACATSSECMSGVCEGQGCGADALGVCVSTDRGCTRDIKTYCGCNGVQFEASGTCPSRRYAARGVCPIASPSTAPTAPQ